VRHKCRLVKHRKRLPFNGIHIRHVLIIAATWSAPVPTTISWQAKTGDGRSISAVRASSYNDRASSYNDMVQ